MKENKMPLIPGMIDTFDKLKELHKKKNDDYAGQNGPFFNFKFTEWLLGHFKYDRDKVYVNQIGIKLARLSVLLGQNGEARNESIEDSFDDLINYCAIWKCAYMDTKRTARLTDAQIQSANTV